MPPEQPPHSPDPATAARQWAEYLERYDRYLAFQAEIIEVRRDGISAQRDANRICASAQAANQNAQREHKEAVEKTSKRVMLIVGVATAGLLTFGLVWRHLVLPTLGTDT